MTRDEIIRMAEAARLVTENYDAGFMNLFSAKLERFYAIVAEAAAAAERGECAKVCDRAYVYTNVAGDCAKAIRARGEKG